MAPADLCEKDCNIVVLKTTMPAMPLHAERICPTYHEFRADRPKCRPPIQKTKAFCRNYICCLPVGLMFDPMCHGRTHHLSFQANEDLIHMI